MVVQSETDLNAVDTAGAVGAPNPPVSIPAVALRVLRLMRGHELKLSLAVVFAILAALLSLSPYLAVALALSEMMQPDVSQTALLTIGVLGAAGAGLEKICFGVATTLMEPKLAQRPALESAVQTFQMLEDSRMAADWVETSLASDIKVAK